MGPGDWAAPVEVLHVLGTARPEGAGLARFVMSLASALDGGRFRTHVWFLGSDGPLAAELAEQGAVADVRVLNWRGVFDPVGTVSTWRRLRRRRFGIVHQHMGGPFAQWVLRAATRAPVVAHLWSAVSEAGGLSPARSLGVGADAVVATSSYVAERARRETGVRPSVIYPAAASDAPPPGPAPKAGDGLVIGAACRLVPLKGVEYLIRAVAALRERVPRARLEIAGAGRDESRLQRLAARLGVAERVTFLGWRRDLSEHFPAWDVFGLPSTEEAFGIAALEAMAAGLPVVASDVGGIPELVEDGQTGLLVPPADPDALADALARLLGSPERRASFGAAARERALGTFSPERLASQVTSLYDGLLCRERGSTKRSKGSAPLERR